MTQLERVLEFAVDQIGRGETTGPNAGPYIEKLHRGARDSGNWCSAFVAYCFEEVHCFPVIPDRNRRGAKALVKYIARELPTGVWVYEPDLLGAIRLSDPRPGDVITWHRFDPRRWEGHAELVLDAKDDGSITTVAGNVGKFPAKVHVRQYGPKKWKRGLYGVARLRYLNA